MHQRVTSSGCGGNGQVGRNTGSDPQVLYRIVGWAGDRKVISLAQHTATTCEP